MPAIGEVIKEYRLKAGLSQQQLGEKLGLTSVARQRVAQWENGYRTPASEHLLKIMAVLNIPPRAFDEFEKGSVCMKTLENMLKHGIDAVFTKSEALVFASKVLEYEIKNIDDYYDFEDDEEREYKLTLLESVREALNIECFDHYDLVEDVLLDDVRCITLQDVSNVIESLISKLEF